LMTRVVLSVLTRKDVAVISSLAPLKSAWRPIGMWICGQCKSVAHKPHRPNSNRKIGQMMCYKPRTSSRATDTPFRLNQSADAHHLWTTCPWGGPGVQPFLPLANGLMMPAE
jgi:hypothetical protein